MRHRNASPISVLRKMSQFHIVHVENVDHWNTFGSLLNNGGATTPKCRDGGGVELSV
jgi:hypothetical protein